MQHLNDTFQSTTETCLITPSSSLTAALNSLDQSILNFLIMTTTRQLYSLMVHTVKHSSEELILSKDLFFHLVQGDYIQLSDPDRPSLRLVLKVPALQTTGGTLEASLSKTIAEPLDLKPFTRVCIEKVDPAEAEIDFVELTFRRQFLQRGWVSAAVIYATPLESTVQLYRTTLNRLDLLLF